MGIYITEFKVRVLSDGPLNLSIPVEVLDDDPFDLLAINHAIVEGSCVGYVEEVSSEELSENVVKSTLQEFGNDGEFFDYRLEEEDEWFSAPNKSV